MFQATSEFNTGVIMEDYEKVLVTFTSTVVQTVIQNVTNI